MRKLLAYFRRAHLMALSPEAARRLAGLVRSMRCLEPWRLLKVMAEDVGAPFPRRIDVTLGELRRALGSPRRGAA